MEHYPSWRYHRTEPAQIVETPEADVLGDEWAHSPAEFLEDPPADPAANEKPKKKGK